MRLLFSLFSQEDGGEEELVEENTELNEENEELEEDLVRNSRKMN